MLKLGTLMRATPGEIAASARGIRSRIRHSYIDVDENGENKKVIMDVTGKSDTYTVVFKFYDLRKKNLANSRIYVHCSCAYWTYNLEVAVAARGSSSVINSNGAYPRERNPGMVPHLCKHLLQASRGAIRSKPKRKPPKKIDPHEIQRLLSVVEDVIPD